MWHFLELREEGVGMDPIHDNFFVQDSANLAESLVRETLQNSLDAQVDEGTQVRVRFALNEVPEAKRAIFDRYLSALVPHIQAAKPSLAKACESAKPQFLVIEDFGTKGLMGDTVSNRDTKSGFSNFWRHVGKTEKGSGRGGAFGIGKVVVPMSSSACAFFGVTIRHEGPDSGVPLLMGQSMLPQRSVNGKEFEPFVLYGQKSAPGRAVLPMRDNHCIELSKLAGLTREKEAGTSIAIPFPSSKVEWDQVFLAVMKHYYQPILSGDLVVQYVKQSGGMPILIDKAGLIENAAKVSPDFPHQIKFVEESITRPDSEFISISGNQGNHELNAARFTEDELQALRKRYSDGSLLCFKLQVFVQPKAGEAGFYPLKLFIRKAPDGIEGADLYVRGGISVYSNSTFKGQRASFALELVQEKNDLGEMLRLSEGPAHNQWYISSPRAAEAYTNSGSAIRLCRTALTKLHDILCVGQEKEDASALAAFFPFGMPEVPKKSAPFKLTTNNNGEVFVRKSNEQGAPSVVGIPFSVKIRYEKVGRGRGYSRSDFTLGDKPGEIKVHAKNASFTYDASGNSLTLTPSAEDFELKVGPFDLNRNLDVRANYTK
jgi:hypothetical protein